MIIVCSIHQLREYRELCLKTHGKEPKIYRTTVGKSMGMDQYENLMFFNPTWSMVLGHKNGTMTDAEYRLHYQRLLNARAQECLDWTRSLQHDQDYILLCYCARGNFCHRLIIADKLERHRPDLGPVLRR
jgi:uncharacterized protein DUF488